MSNDDRNTPRDVPFRPAGAGLSPVFMCMGCGKRREGLGARGAGVRRRCALCVAKANDKGASS